MVLVVEDDVAWRVVGNFIVVFFLFFFSQEIRKCIVPMLVFGAL